MHEDPDSVLAGLDELQRACVLHPPGPLAIEAGPGSGKTKVLTARIVHRALAGSADAQHTLAVTFTRRAAAELGRRLTAAGLHGARTATLHAVAHELVARYRADQGLARLRVASDPRRLVAEAIDGLDGVSVDLVLPDLEWAAARGLGPSGLADAVGRGERRTVLEASLLAEVSRRYERVKRSRGVLDLGDLLVEAERCLADPPFGAATSWWFRHVLVDEAQDLNLAQWRLVRAIVGAGDDLCLVGDPDQAVYGWNGADCRFLTRLEAEFPGAARLRLGRNYRCPAPVVRAAREVLRSGSVEVAGTSPGDGHPGEDDPLLVTPTEYGGPGPAVTVFASESDDEEAAAVVARLRSALVEGVGPGQLAVLARTNRALRPVVAALDRAGIPHHTGRGLLHEPEVRRALERLRSAPAPARGPACASRLAEVVEELRTEQAVQAERVEQVEQVGRSEQGGSRAVEPVPRGGRTPPPDCLDQLLELVDEWADVQPRGRPGDFVHWLGVVAGGRSADLGPAAPAVQLATFHRAKGLQWRRVFVIGLSSDRVPLPPPADQAEERRLLYVALTRAAESVCCSWPTKGGSLGPSPFLGPVLEVAEEDADPDPALVASRLRALREELLRRRATASTRPLRVPASRPA